MAADVVKGFNRSRFTSDCDDALQRDLAQEIIARVGNAIGTSRAEPAVEKETLDLAVKEFVVRVVAPGQCCRNVAQIPLLRPERRSP
jgi:hypothetical protein